MDNFANNFIWCLCLAQLELEHLELLFDESVPVWELEAHGALMQLVYAQIDFDALE